MEYPALVFKCPGQHQRAGGTFDYASVGDEEGMKEAKAAGWHETLPEAIAAAETTVGKQETQATAAKPASAAKKAVPAASWGSK